MSIVSGILAILFGVYALGVLCWWWTEPPNRDVIPSLNVAGVILAEVLLLSGTLEIWKEKTSLLLLSWVLTVSYGLTFSLQFIVPPWRASLGLPPLTGAADVVAAFLGNRAFLLSLLGLLLVLPKWLRMRREKAGTPSEAEN